MKRTPKMSEEPMSEEQQQIAQFVKDYPAISQLQGTAVAAYREKIKRDIEAEIVGYKQMRDGWKRDTANYETYDLTVRVLNRVVTLLDQPLK